MSGNTNDSGELLRQVLELAEGEIHEIGEHVATIDKCLRGDMASEKPGLIERMNARENACRQNHGVNGNRQVPVPGAPESTRQVIWTVDKIILAIATAVSVLIASFGALTSQCNSREIRRDRSHWRSPAGQFQRDTTGR